jgi:hypothetical protein
MRRIPVDHVPTNRLNRGGDCLPVTMNEDRIVSGYNRPSLLDLDDTFEARPSIDARKAQLERCTTSAA